MCPSILFNHASFQVWSGDEMEDINILFSAALLCASLAVGSFGMCL